MSIGLQQLPPLDLQVGVDGCHARVAGAGLDDQGAAAAQLAQSSCGRSIQRSRATSVRQSSAWSAGSRRGRRRAAPGRRSTTTSGRCCGTSMLTARTSAFAPPSRAATVRISTSVRRAQPAPEVGAERQVVGVEVLGRHAGGEGGDLAQVGRAAALREALLHLAANERMPTRSSIRLQM